MPTTIKIGKRGTLVLPAKLRKQFGLDEGSLLITETKDGEIRLRPALLYEPEVWSPERTAYFMLVNSLTKEEWDRAVPDVVAMGFNPNKVEGVPLNYRSTLPSEKEWNKLMGKTANTPARKKLSA